MLNPPIENSFGFPGRYFSDPTILRDGETAPLLIDQLRRLITVTTPAAPSPTNMGYGWRYVSSALGHEGVARAAAAVLCQAIGSIDPSEATAVYYLQFFNSTTVPADATVPVLSFPIDHTTAQVSTFNLVLDTNSNGGDKGFTNGVSWCISSTQFTKTVVASNKAALTIYGF